MPPVQRKENMNDQIRFRVKRINKIIPVLEQVESRFFTWNMKPIANAVNEIIDCGIELAGMLQVYGWNQYTRSNYFKFMDTAEVTRLNYERYKNQMS